MGGLMGQTGKILIFIETGVTVTRVFLLLFYFSACLTF